MYVHENNIFDVRSEGCHLHAWSVSLLKHMLLDECTSLSLFAGFEAYARFPGMMGCQARMLLEHECSDEGAAEVGTTFEHTYVVT